MPSTIKKRGGVWQYDSNTYQNRLRISLKTPDRRIALREQRGIDKRLAQKRLWEGTDFTRPLGTVIDGYLAWISATKSLTWVRRQGQILRHFNAWNQKKYTHQILSTDIERYMLYRADHGASVATLRKELHVLSRLWGRAIRDGAAGRNVVDGIEPPRRKPPKQTRPFSSLEVAAILEDQKGHPRHPIFAVLYYTGLRLGDVITMQVDEFNLAGGMWERRIGKTGRVMRMPLAKPLLSILRAYLPLEGPAFPRFYPGPGRQSTTVRRNLYRAIQMILKRLKLPKGNLYSFRHAFNQKLMELGLGIEDRQVLMGHSASRTTKIYTHGNEDLARTYLDKL